MASAKTVAHHLTYGGKRDYPKIDIFPAYCPSWSKTTAKFQLSFEDASPAMAETATSGEMYKRSGRGLRT
jgi:hypothetical protein